MIENFLNNFIKPQYREDYYMNHSLVKQIKEIKHLLNY